jgi:predicted TIM-barrel fold metal-dependent hydrolase
MPSADAHAHLFAEGFGGVLGGPPVGSDELSQYERLRRHHGIERTLVIGYEGERRYQGNNDYVLALAQSLPWIAPVAYLPISPTPTVDNLLSLHVRGALGFAVYLPGHADGATFADWPSETLRELRSQRAILSLNAPPPATSAAAEVIRGLDECPVLISHLGLPGRFASVPSLEDARQHLKPLLALSRFEHVSVKLSGLYAISDPPHGFPHAAAKPFVQTLLDAFTPARLLWGSDFSPALDFVSFAQTTDPQMLDDCSAAEAEAVMGGNLLRLLAARHLSDGGTTE